MPQPSKQLRTVVPIIVFGVAALLVSLVIFSPGSDRTKASNEDVTSSVVDVAATETEPVEESKAAENQPAADSGASAATAESTSSTSSRNSCVFHLFHGHDYHGLR